MIIPAAASGEGAHEEIAVAAAGSCSQSSLTANQEDDLQ
jgi:hypothetical protein